jgi:hypothetical protein
METTAKFNQTMLSRLYNVYKDEGMSELEAMRRAHADFNTFVGDEDEL